MSAIDLHIMGWRDAPRHQPIKPTYAIRLISTFINPPIPPLQNSSLYVATPEYIFDDVLERDRPGSFTITPEIAQKIVRDFAQWRNEIEALLIHCSHGRNRAPAVAIGLSEGFELGHDIGALKHQYSFEGGQRSPYNQKVYQLVLAAVKTYRSSLPLS